MFSCMVFMTGDTVDPAFIPGNEDLYPVSFPVYVPSALEDALYADYFAWSCRNARIACEFPTDTVYMRKLT